MPCVSSCLLILSHVPLDSRASFLAVKVLRAVWLLVVESCRIDYGGVRPCHVRALGQAPKRGPRPRSSGALCGCIHLHPVLMSCRLSPPHVDVCGTCVRLTEACTHARIHVYVQQDLCARTHGAHRYFLSAPASAIVAQPGTLTGSIGVVGGKFVVGQFLEEVLGVNVGIMSRGKRAGVLSGVRPFSPDGRAWSLAPRMLVCMFLSLHACVSSNGWVLNDLCGVVLFVCLPVGVCKLLSSDACIHPYSCANARAHTQTTHTRTHNTGLKPL